MRGADARRGGAGGGPAGSDLRHDSMPGRASSTGPAETAILARIACVSVAEPG